MRIIRLTSTFGRRRLGGRKGHRQRQLSRMASFRHFARNELSSFRLITCRTAIHRLNDKTHNDQPGEVQTTHGSSLRVLRIWPPIARS